MKALLVVAALALLAVPPAVAELEATHQVSIRNNRYDPQVLQIKPGDTVTWTDFDPDLFWHSVSDRLGAFDSGQMVQGDVFSHTFAQEGIALYTCAHHATMNGVVIVRA